MTLARTLADFAANSPDKATDAELRGGTANKFPDAASVYAASARVQLTDAANISVDMDAGRNFYVVLGGNRTLDNPTNQTAGQSGSIPSWRASSPPTR